MIALSCCFEMSAFAVRRKAIPSFVWQKIIESWLELKGPSQIGQKLRLLKQTIAKIVDNFICRRNIEDNKGGNDTWSAHADAVNIDIEFCKTTNPSIYRSEIQNKLVENNVCLPKNVLLHASISCSLTQNLGLYSFKKFSITDSWK